MSRSRVTLFSFSFRHHGQYSSFHRLVHYSAGCDVIDATFRWGALLNQRWFERFERRWLRMRERRLRRVFARPCHQCVHYIYPENSLVAGDLWKNGHRLVLSCHQPGRGLSEIESNPAFANFFRALRQAERVVLLSSNSLPDYERFCPADRLAVIPHGIDVEFFQPPSAPPKRPLILTVGNWLRDYDFWLETATRLARARSDVEFAVVALPRVVRGVRERAERELGTRVRFISGVSDTQLRQLYHDASVLFLPLADASANNAVLEGMACGLPILASDLPAVREYAGDAALNFKLGDTNVAAALDRLLRDEPLRQALGAAARRRAVSEFAWPVIARRYRQLYDELLR